MYGRVQEPRATDTELSRFLAQLRNVIFSGFDCNLPNSGSRWADPAREPAGHTVFDLVV